jgi:hypothetical protein
MLHGAISLFGVRTGMKNRRADTDIPWLTLVPGQNCPGRKGFMLQGSSSILFPEVGAAALPHHSGAASRYRVS